ncbi:MAG: VirB8/TrbF family protein [Terriglobales bacterium]
MSASPSTTPSRLTAAAAQYLEQYGSPIVTNSYLRIAVAALSLLCLGTLALAFHTQKMVQNFKPLVIRIDSVGRAQAVNYNAFAYRPQAAEARYFLAEWARLFFGRNRYTVQDDFSRSLHFLNANLAANWMDSYRKGKVIENFLSDGTQPGIDINVQQISIEDMRTQPYRATIDFDEVAYNQADHATLSRAPYTASVVFVFRKDVPASMVPVNPLGLTITYFHLDKAF